MHPSLAKAVEPVLRDVRSTGAGEFSIEDEAWAQFPGMESAMVSRRDGTGTGISIQTSATTPQQISSVADQVQEFVVENLQREQRTNWPPCPEHPTTHPMRADVRGGLAVWLCPVTGTVGAPIGELPESGALPGSRGRTVETLQ